MEYYLNRGYSLVNDCYNRDRLIETKLNNKITMVEKNSKAKASSEKTSKDCNSKKCSNCGKDIILLDAKLCPYCGSPLSETETKKNVENTVVATPKVFTVKGVSFTMIPVQGGTYTMGAAENDSDAYDNEKPAHKETVADFMIGETLVTQELWKAVMGNSLWKAVMGINPSHFKRDGSRPVECVSWDDCQKFITKLNQLTGQFFRLPYEAEWEYAARGGNKSKGYKYAGSNDEYAVAWVDYNSEKKTHPVKTKKPNELGIYDMSGNVWEWCQDKYSEDYESPRNGTFRVLRGGSWNLNARFVRVSSRIYFDPGNCDNSGGLRLAL